MDGVHSSVLFDQGAGAGAYGYGQPAAGDGLQFYSFAGRDGADANAYGADFAKDAGGFDGRVDWRAAFGTGGFANEPPLLEELGINFSHIFKKSLTVLNPFTAVDKDIMNDTDLAGPLIFCLLFGGFLLLSGKIHFGYIYGVAFMGTIGIYAILNLMADVSIDGWRTASVLGYCLLPMVILSLISSVLRLGGGPISLVLAGLSVVWCTYSASTMFVTVLSMNHQRALVAYPVGLLYSIFALLAIFSEDKIPPK
ncbi:hypothetical protein DFJ74DRAFT_708509 [Hyaloraphidium curvatum]|nr:hypothetical protein DFJ74DRAFT_708509 [Hyaloraphidium curvatum]